MTNTPKILEYLITWYISIDQGYPWSVRHLDNSEQGELWDRGWEVRILGSWDYEILGLWDLGIFGF